MAVFDPVASVASGEESIVCKVSGFIPSMISPYNTGRVKMYVRAVQHACIQSTKKNDDLIHSGCESIHLEAVLVPQYRYRGSNASLLCKYELEPNEELFSLKWYKEDTEFYRHTPQDPRSQPPPINSYGQPPQFSPHQPSVIPVNAGLVQTWQVPGIKIDVSKIN